MRTIGMRAWRSMAAVSSSGRDDLARRRGCRRACCERSACCSASASSHLLGSGGVLRDQQFAGAQADAWRPRRPARGTNQRRTRALVVHAARTGTGRRPPRGGRACSPPRARRRGAHAKATAPAARRASGMRRRAAAAPPAAGAGAGAGTGRSAACSGVRASERCNCSSARAGSKWTRRPSITLPLTPSTSQAGARRRCGGRRVAGQFGGRPGVGVSGSAGRPGHGRLVTALPWPPRCRRCAPPGAAHPTGRANQLSAGAAGRLTARSAVAAALIARAVQPGSRPHLRGRKVTICGKR